MGRGKGGGMGRGREGGWGEGRERRGERRGERGGPLGVSFKFAPQRASELLASDSTIR